MAEATLNGQALYFYDLEWLGQVFGKQLEAYFGGSPVKTIEHPKVNRAHFSDEYAIFVRDEDLLPEERLLLILALAPHIRPAYLDDLLSKHVKQSGDFPQIGGGRGKHFRGFIPTGETFLFIIAGAHDKQRIETKQWLHPEARLFSKRILHLEAVSSGEPSASGKITVDTEFLEWFLFGKKSIPKISPDFPAQHLQTKLTWDDLVLNPMTQEQIREIEMWVKHHKTLLNDWEMSRRLSPGYKALFHGPPGTGKNVYCHAAGQIHQP
jgi:hypothetical protein